MLVLTRKLGESLMISDNVTIKVLRIQGQQVRLGIDAPKEIPIVREEYLKPPDTSLTAQQHTTL